MDMLNRCVIGILGGLLTAGLALAALSCSGGGGSPGFGNTNSEGITDPGSGIYYRVVPHVVDVQIKPAPDMPWGQSNWFDVDRTNDPLYDDYVAWFYGGFFDEARVQDFIAAEQLKVKELWDPGGGMLVVLPHGMTVQEALDRWPAQYSELLWSVSPLYVEEGGDWYDFD